MNKEVKLKFKVDIETFKALIAACVVRYQHFLKVYQHALEDEGAASLLAYEWAEANVDKVRTHEPNVEFKIKLSVAFALISALEDFDDNHPLSVVIAREIRDKLHKVIIANQNAYRIENIKELLP
jgi:hypothetical protein